MLNIGLALTGRTVGRIGLPIVPELSPRSTLLLSRAAAEPVQTMTTPPTFTVGAANTNSTVIPSSSTAFGGGNIEANNPLIEPIGGLIALFNNQYQGAGMFGTSDGRRGSFGQGIRFRHSSPIFDIAVQEGQASSQSNPGLALYVTEGGARRRAQASDYRTGDVQRRYVKWDFGSSADRTFELYFPFTGSLRSLNLQAGYTLQPLPTKPQPKVAFIWDSFGAGTVSQAAMSTLAVKKAAVTTFSEAFGIDNPLSLSNGGTGFANPGGTNGNYLTRIQAGDLDRARWGDLDLVVIPGSVNDHVSATGGVNDATLTTAVTNVITAAAAAQPKALIVSWAPEGTPNRPYDATRNSVMRSAFNAVAAADANPGRFYYIETSYWWSQIAYGPDNTHPTDIGHVTLGTLMANTLAADLEGPPEGALQNGEGGYVRNSSGGYVVV